MAWRVTGFRASRPHTPDRAPKRPHAHATRATPHITRPDHPPPRAMPPPRSQPKTRLPLTTPPPPPPFRPSPSLPPQFLPVIPVAAKKCRYAFSVWVKRVAFRAISKLIETRFSFQWTEKR